MQQMTQQMTREDIQAGIERIAAAHDRWLEMDYPGDHVPPEDFAEALADFAQVGLDPTGCPKELPSDLETLHLLETALLLLVQWTQYQQQADLHPEGLPLPYDFRRAYTRMVSLYQKSLEQQDRKSHTAAIKSVKHYRDTEKLTDYQIAVQYGRLVDGGKYEGVFFTSTGSVRFEQIQQEYDQPGSVIKETWRHPRDLAEQREQAEQVQLTLRTVSGLANVFFRGGDDTPPDDPDTVEELLRQGQYPDIIAYKKGVSEEDVHAEAKRLGIPTNWRENPNRWRYIAREEPQAIPVQQQYSSEEITEMIRAEKEADPEANTQEIADRVNQRAGLQLTRQKVGKVLNG